MKRGFTLIEVMIATMLAGIASTLMLNMIWQQTRSQGRAELRMDLYGRAIVATNQLQRDLMGAFVPARPQEQKEQQQKEEPKQAAQKEAEEQAKPKKIERQEWNMS